MTDILTEQVLLQLSQRGNDMGHVKIRGSGAIKSSLGKFHDAYILEYRT